MAELAARAAMARYIEGVRYEEATSKVKLERPEAHEASKPGWAAAMVLTLRRKRVS